MLFDDHILQEATSSTDKTNATEVFQQLARKLIILHHFSIFCFFAVDANTPILSTWVDHNRTHLVIRM